MSRKSYQFGEFVLNVEKRRLLDRNKTIQLSARAFEILRFLIERRGAIVTKDELLEQIWSDTFVEEINLAVHVSAIRRVLREKRGENKFIETISGRGYCFVAPVRETESNDETASPENAAAGASETKSKIYALAVLPFANDGGMSKLEYLIGGINESLINTLSQLPQLKVFARNAVLRYKNQNPNLQEIGFLLGAEVILTGRITIIDEELEISVELVKVLDQSHIWGFQYNFQLTDFAKIKHEISLAVAEKLQIKLGERDALPLEQQATSSAAFKLCLKGQYLLAKRTLEELLKAADFFQRALKKDPDYALAYAGIADVYFLLCIYQYSRPLDAIPKAKAAIERALRLDPTLPQVHATNGNLQFRYEYKWREAEQSFKKALALNPSNAVAHHRYGSFLLYSGRFQESISHLNQALELDPFSLHLNARLAACYSLVGKYGEAITQFEEFLEFEPDFFFTYYHLAVAYANLGFYETALANIEKGFALSPIPEAVIIKSWIHALAGNETQAREILNEVLRGKNNKVISYYDIATVYTALGETDEALNCLEKAVELKDLDVCAIKVEARFAPLRSESRFKILLEQIGLE